MAVISENNRAAVVMDSALYDNLEGLRQRLRDLSDEWAAFSTSRTIVRDDPARRAAQDVSAWLEDLVGDVVFELRSPSRAELNSGQD